MAHETRIDDPDSDSNTAENGKLVLILFGLVFAVFGFGFAGVGYWIHSTSSDLQEEAVITDGQITDNSIEEDLDTSSDSNRYDYEVRVEYQYEYENSEYTGNSITPVSSLQVFSSRSAAQDYTSNKYPVGRNVDVYVIPDNPENAFLEEESTSDTLLFIGFGLFFGLVGLLIMYRGYNNMTDEKSEE